MADSLLPRFRPDEQLQPRPLNQLAEELERALTRQYHVHGYVGGAGSASGEDLSEEIWVRVVSQDITTHPPAHGWEQVIENRTSGGAGFVQQYPPDEYPWLADPYGLRGSTTALPLYDRLGRLLDVGQVVRAHRGLNADYFIALAEEYVFVKNTTGSTLPARSVLALGTPLSLDLSFPERFLAQAAFNGVVPTSVRGPFAITERQLSNNEIGRARALGLVVVAVDIQNITHQWAAPEATATAGLKSVATASGARIVYSPGVTGLQTCVVDLGVFSHVTFLAQLGTVSGVNYPWAEWDVTAGAVMAGGRTNVTEGLSARAVVLPSFPITGQVVPITLNHTGSFYWFFPHSAVGGGGGGGGGGLITSVCDFVRLARSDCLTAVSEDYAAGPTISAQTILLVHSGAGTWTGEIDMDYPAGSGPVVFSISGGVVHLLIDGKELLGCGDGCFEGGKATGHVDEAALPTIPLACTGPAFRVCISCLACPDCSDLPDTLTAEVTDTGAGQCDCMEGTYSLTRSDPAVQAWMGGGGSCVAAYTLSCTNNGDGTVTLALDILCGATNTGSATATVSVADLDTLDVTFNITMSNPACSPANCVYTWNSMAGWQLTTDCAGECDCSGGPPGAPGSVDGETQSFPCNPNPACCVGTISVRVTV